MSRRVLSLRAILILKISNIFQDALKCSRLTERRMCEITRFLFKLSTVAEIRRNPLTGLTITKCPLNAVPSECVCVMPYASLRVFNSVKLKLF